MTAATRGQVSAPVRASAVDFVLEGLYAQKKISRSDEWRYQASEQPRRPTRVVQDTLMDREIGAVLIVAGLAIAGVGLLAYAGGLTWFGHLPGDIRVEGENTKVFIPITSMLIVSLVLSLAFALFRRLF